MSRNIQYLRGFSLPTVLVISVLMALLIMFAFSLVDLDRLYYANYHKRKQSVLDLHSASALYCVDSLLTSGSDSIGVCLFDDAKSEVGIKIIPWGLYEIMTASVKALPFSRSMIYGRSSESPTKAALWVSDRKRALSIAGRTRIDGAVFASLNGINYTDLSGVPFSGEHIPAEMSFVSSSGLPLVDSLVLDRLDSLRSLAGRAWYHLNDVEGYRSFQEQTSLVYARDGDKIFHLGGNRILYADRLTLGADSEVNGILVFACSAVIAEGFRGSLQLFCTDTVTVGRDVRLESPSGVLVSGADHPFVSLAGGSRVCGYVAVLNDGKIDQRLEHPCFRQRSGSMIDGLLYVDGSCELKGAVNGAAYIGDCFYEKDGYKYPGVLNNVSVHRSDSVSYPILLTGPYRRREIKKVF